MRVTYSLLSLSLLGLLLSGPLRAQENAEVPQTELSPPAENVPGAQGRQLTLEESIAKAMGESHYVIAAKNVRDAAREVKRQGLSRLGPSATVSYNQVHFEDKQEVDFGGNRVMIRDDVTKNGSLVVSQPITGLYGYIENARLGDLQDEKAEEDLRLAKSSAGFAGAEAFLRAYNAQEQVKIAEGSVAASQSSAQDASAAQRVGRLNKSDYLKLQVSLSQAQSRLASAKAERVASITTLRQLLRLPPTDVFYLKQDLPEIKAIEPQLDAAIQEALEKKPAVKIAEMSAEEVSFQKKLAYTEFIPTVDVFAQLDRNFGEITALGNPERDTKYWGIRASWTFWNNGASVFKTRQAFAQTRAAEASAEATKDEAKVEVTSALENLKAARERMKLAELSMQQAEEAYRIDGIRFKNGSITATEQVFSENTKASAQGDFVNAKTQLILSHFRLQKALGYDQPQL